MMSKNPYLLSSYQFQLPQELIAQHPQNPRDRSRLLIVDRNKGNFSEIIFKDLTSFLQSKDSRIFNNTKVIPARLIGKREKGGEAEIFLLKQLNSCHWEILAKPGKKLPNGAFVVFGEDFRCEIVESFDDGRKIAAFYFNGEQKNFDLLLQQYGSMPLPHYIRKGKSEHFDKESYQTVYASQTGAVAAPTAGLHFTQEMLKEFTKKEISQHYVTLHVGMGTFRPVQVEDIRKFKIHSESVNISEETAQALNRHVQEHRQICVGTTCCRTLESAVDCNGKIRSGEFTTDIFIYPGYQFKYVKSLLTNFHLPGSSLLMLVCAFGGYELMMEAYAKAVKDRFRFFSYGDAMLIL